MAPLETRQKLGLNASEMARLMGVHRETWAKWEDGRREPNEAAKTLMGVFAWMHDAGCLADYVARH